VRKVFTQKCFQLRLFDILEIVFSSFAIFASILVDTFSSSFMRFFKLCDGALDPNKPPQTGMRTTGYMS